MRKTLIREKKILCGRDYLEVDIYAIGINERSKGRSKKKKVSLIKQKNINDKNAKRRFRQIAEANFNNNDLVLHLTYSDDMLPKTIEDAEKEVKNYIRRLKRLRKKSNLEELKYMLITEGGTDEENGECTRVHHHLLISGGIDRDKVENLWRKKKDGKITPIGYANADRIQVSKNDGITALCNYLVKRLNNKKSKKRWSCSQNLTHPIITTNDFKYSRKKLINIATNNISLDYWESIYKGWTIKDKDAGYKVEYNDFTGWSIYLRLRKKE